MSRKDIFGFVCLMATIVGISYLCKRGSERQQAITHLIKESEQKSANSKIMRDVRELIIITTNNDTIIIQ